MNKVSIIIPHFKTWKWTAICINAFKSFPIPVQSEIVLVDNSPGHPSIKAITETSLGDGIKVVSGNPNFTSHGMGYDIAVNSSDGDWIFASETDSFPTHFGWFDEYIRAANDHDIIGPSVPQSSGRYIHPAGSLYRRLVLDAATRWRESNASWVFCPGMAVKMGLSEKPYHVVCRNSDAPINADSSALDDAVELWKLCGSFQEMRSFDEDDWDTYPSRTKIDNFAPVSGKNKYLKIGYEAGQWLHYFAVNHGFRCMEASSTIKWMAGFDGGQAEFSTVFGKFKHCWCGTVSSLGVNLDPAVLKFKTIQARQHFENLPMGLRVQIESLEKSHQA